MPRGAASVPAEENPLRELRFYKSFQLVYNSRTMSDLDISIRPLETWDEYLAAEELQRSVWQMPDWRDAVPANLLIAVYKNGGIVLGAFDGAKMIGFVFSRSEERRVGKE